MRKNLLIVCALMLIIVIAACRQAVEEKEEVKKASEVGEVESVDGPADAIGNEINDISSIERDLGSEELSGLDSDLADIQNI